MSISVRLAAAYVVVAGTWAWVARAIVPSVIASAHDGGSLPLLNHVLGPRYSLDFYLDRWAAVSRGVLVAIAVHAALGLALGAMNRRRAREVEGPGGRANTVLLTFGGVFLLVTALSGARHDYFPHLVLWDSILEGGDPWAVGPGFSGPLNAYGPLFNTLALLVPINPYAPKLLLASAYLLFVFWLVTIEGPRHGRAGLSRAAIAAWIVNPLPWAEVAFTGHFDVLVGLAIVAAIHARQGAEGAARGEVAAGAALGLGALLKFLPLVVLPFLSVDRRRLRWRLVAAFGGTVAAGLLISVAIWGPSLAAAMSQMVTRPSTLLSIFRVLRGEWSPLRPWVAPATIDALATPILAAAGLLLFAWCWRRAIDPAKGTVLAVLTTVALYHVGYVQYRFVLFLVLSYWMWTQVRPTDHGAARLAGISAVYVAALAVFDVFYIAIGGVIIEGTRWGWIQEIAGLPAFVLELLLFVAVAKTAGNRVSCNLEQPGFPGRSTSAAR